MESPWKTLEAAAKAVVDETAATGDTDIEGIDNRTEYTLITPSNCLKKQDHLTVCAAYRRRFELQTGAPRLSKRKFPPRVAI